MLFRARPRTWVALPVVFELQWRAGAPDDAKDGCALRTATGWHDGTLVLPAGAALQGRTGMVAESPGGRTP
jgi:hypothetical protein